MKRLFPALALAALSLASCSRFARSQPAVVEDASQSSTTVPTPATAAPSTDASDQGSAERLHELEERAKQLDAAKAELQSLQRETEERKANADALERQIADLRASATQREAEQHAKQQKARARIAQLSSHAEKLEQELASYKQDREPSPSTGSAELVKVEQRSVSAEITGVPHRSDEAVLADRAILTKRLGDVDREGSALDANSRDPQARIVELEQELADLKKSSQSRLEALESVLANTRASGADLRSQLDATRARNAELSEQVGDLKGSVSKLHDLRTTLVEKQRRLDELHSENAADSGEVKTLKLQVADLQAELNKARSVQQTNTRGANEPI